MHYLTTIALLIASAVGATVHQVILKVASNHGEWGKAWLTYMAIGYAIGVLPPLFIALAYKQNNPIIILAIGGGVAMPILYGTMYFCFKQPMTRLQVIGVALACIGAVLVQLGPIQEQITAPKNEAEPSQTDVTGG